MHNEKDIRALGPKYANGCTKSNASQHFKKLTGTVSTRSWFFFGSIRNNGKDHHLPHQRNSRLNHLPARSLAQFFLGQPGADIHWIPWTWSHYHRKCLRRKNKNWRQEIIEKQRGKLAKKILFYQDNAAAPKSAVTTAVTQDSILGCCRSNCIWDPRSSAIFTGLGS